MLAWLEEDGQNVDRLLRFNILDHFLGKVGIDHLGSAVAKSLLEHSHPLFAVLCFVVSLIFIILSLRIIFPPIQPLNRRKSLRYMLFHPRPPAFCPLLLWSKVFSFLIEWQFDWA